MGNCLEREKQEQELSSLGQPGYAKKTLDRVTARVQKPHGGNQVACEEAVTAQTDLQPTCYGQ